jgi:hypothetical protein
VVVVVVVVEVVVVVVIVKLADPVVEECSEMVVLFKPPRVDSLVCNVDCCDDAEVSALPAISD